MKFIIDRLEGKKAIVELESKKIIEINQEILPKEAKEGDILEISILKDETKEKRDKLSEKFNSLIKNKKD